LIGVALLWAPAAMAQDAASPGAIIRGHSVCPEPAAVWSEIDQLVVRDRLEPRLRALAEAAHPIEVFDLGASFRVLAAGRTRDYLDEARDCANRARLASLFVALAVDSSGEPPPAPGPAPVVAVAAAPAEGPIPSRLGRLEVDAAFEVGGTAAWLAPGAGLRLVVGRAALGIVAGARGTLPGDATLDGVGLRVWRVGVDLLLRATFGRERALRPFVELGAAATFLSVRAPELAAPRDDSGFEGGLVAAAGVHLARRAALWPFACARAELIPRPVTVFARPAGSIGDTPHVWAGVSVGVSLGVF
jgi:hypothetical protein